MEALRRASVGATLTVAIVLQHRQADRHHRLARLGQAPGGALTPTMSIASGTALLSLYGAEHLGVEVGAGVAVGA